MAPCDSRKLDVRWSAICSRHLSLSYRPALKAKLSFAAVRSNDVIIKHEHNIVSCAYIILIIICAVYAQVQIIAFDDQPSCVAREVSGSIR